MDSSCKLTIPVVVASLLSKCHLVLGAVLASSTPQNGHLMGHQTVIASDTFTNLAFLAGCSSGSYSVKGPPGVGMINGPIETAGKAAELGKF